MFLVKTQPFHSQATADFGSLSSQLNWGQMRERTRNPGMLGIPAKGMRTRVETGHELESRGLRASRTLVSTQGLVRRSELTLSGLAARQAPRMRIIGLGCASRLARDRPSICLSP